MSRTDPRSVAALRLVLAVAAWLGLLATLRFGFMEIEAKNDPCLLDATGLACRARALLGLAIHLQILGTAALAAALAAQLPLAGLRRPLAYLALFAALLALVLYNVRYGAPAAVLAMLALADSGALREGG